MDKYPYREEKENKEGNDFLCELQFLQEYRVSTNDVSDYISNFNEQVRTQKLNAHFLKEKLKTIALMRNK